MISWTIPGTVAGLTGATTVSGSSSSSSSGSAQGNSFAQPPFAETAIGSASAQGFSSYFGSTSHAASGSTTYFSYTFSSTYTEKSNVTFDLTPEAQTNTNNTYLGPTTAEYTNSSSTSGSSSDITTAQATAIAETSTTEAYVSAYESYYTTSFEAGEGQAPVWTTSSETIAGGTETSVVFYQTDATSISLIEFSYLTRVATSDAVTTLDQTITLSAIPNTVVQAETRYPNAEIIYLQTAQIANVDVYTAATDLAQSGTRLTVSPVIITSAKAPADYSRPTSSIASQQSTSLVNLTSSTFTQDEGTRTLANYFFFPPTTASIVFVGMTTTEVLYATNLLSFQQAITHGGTTNTVTAKECGTYWRVVTRQIGSRTFEAAVQDTTSYSVTRALEAAASSSTEETASGTTGYSILAGAYTNQGQSSSITQRSSVVSANTVFPTARVVIGAGGQARQLKYGTYGAAIGSQKGGWMTANATSEFGAAFSDIYALDGGGRFATTMFPVTNEYRTINATGISWTQSTTANPSVDGATSKKTTTSASFGVSGAPQTTSIAQPISNFGGSAGEGETFVQTAPPGVYKNRIDGATTSFDGSATVITAQQSESLVMWQAIRGVTGMVSSTNANPVTWMEARNSTALPPAMPPYA